MPNAFAGVQSDPHQDELFWHEDHFELKTIEILWAQKKLLPFS